MKTLSPLVKFWHRKCVKIVLYLGDGIGAAKGKAHAESGSNLVRRTLVQAGLVSPSRKMLLRSIPNHQVARVHSEFV